MVYVNQNGLCGVLVNLLYSNLRQFVSPKHYWFQYITNVWISIDKISNFKIKQIDLARTCSKFTYNILSDEWDASTISELHVETN